MLNNERDHRIYFTYSDAKKAISIEERLSVRKDKRKDANDVIAEFNAELSEFYRYLRVLRDYEPVSAVDDKGNIMWSAPYSKIWDMKKYHDDVQAWYYCVFDFLESEYKEMFKDN